ncbi:MAG: DUF3696 domain-containing protein [Rhodobacteraceae bacterium]|nr:DUF3696 domain-containing protein [Paracoccaceae bacterium]
MMEYVTTVENFRCFKNRQSARLAPLTILVGENSTGKSSLMAMIGILWNSVIHQEFKPRFKYYPFDLGTFTDVIHGNEGEEFSGGFSIGDYKSEITFRKGNVDPEVYSLITKNIKSSITLTRSNGKKIVKANSSGGNLVIDLNKLDELGLGKESLGIEQMPLFRLFDYLKSESFRKDYPNFKNSFEIAELCLWPYSNLARKYKPANVFCPPWVSSPFQAKPQRVYTPGGGILDPDGEKIPAYLAELEYSNTEDWEKIKFDIEYFGKKTGVFDELNIRHLGDDRSRDPFQIQVRKAHGNNIGEWRNLMDVGFGVSQLLPFLVHLARPSTEFMLNFQQPEVHLHPSGQAGLGSLLCEAATKRHILVETHSDFLIDRVRMDVRDKKSTLKPEDVSILYFERINTDEVKIHNIRIDDNGSIKDSPPNYREFFSQELDKSLGI